MSQMKAKQAMNSGDPNLFEIVDIQLLCLLPLLLLLLMLDVSIRFLFVAYNY